MHASVIIPAYNAAQTISTCLDALRRQDSAAGFEIIVVDDCSVDQTAELANAADITLIRHSRRRGAAAARNSGIDAAQGEIVCFTDADCAPRQDWIAEVTAPFSDPATAGCKGRYATNQNELVARFVQVEYEDKYNLLQKQDRIDFIDTYSAAYRRDILIENNGFDEQFTFLEDQELSFRLATRAYKMVFQPSAIVYHQHADSLARYAKKKFTIGYWKAQVVRRFPGRAIRDSHTPQVMKLQIVLVTLMAAALAGIIITRWSALILAAALFAFVASTAPFLAKAWRKDIAVAAAAPFLLFVRAASLGTGYAWGLARPVRDLDRNSVTIGGAKHGLKRTVDIVGSLFGLLAGAAAGLLIAPAIKLDSSGPIIYKQQRAGEGGKPFVLYKFRSMSVQPSAELAALPVDSETDLTPVKLPDDPRLTTVGRFLRRWSLDELPQFWNVLRGEMSLVGPRPEEMRFVRQYNDWQRRRLSVKPGITGPMQISGRADLPLDERVQLEIDYIENYSFTRDLAIMLRTIPAVIRGKGAR